MQQVLANHGIRKNRNIFLVDKQEVERSIEENVPNVRVVNIEKRFPNRITVNYTEIMEYLAIVQDGKTYICSNDGKILRVAEGVADGADLIRLKLRGNMTSTEPGQEFASADSAEVSIVRSALDAIERMGYYGTVIDLLSAIDLSNSAYIRFEISTGMTWKIFGADDLAQKLSVTLAAYYELSDDAKKTGEFTVVKKAGSGEIQASYDADPDK